MELTLTIAEVAMSFGFSIGFLWGEAFSNVDGKIKHESDWFKSLSPVWQWFVESLLDATHHFQYGLGVILYTMLMFPEGSVWYMVLYTLGWGLVVSDWKDYKNVLKRLTDSVNTDE